MVLRPKEKSGAAAFIERFVADAALDGMQRSDSLQCMEHAARLRRRIRRQTPSTLPQSPDRQRWITPVRRGFLFPTAALSKVFRGKYLDFLTTAHRNGELRMPGADGPDDTCAVECLKTSLQSSLLFSWLGAVTTPRLSSRPLSVPLRKTDKGLFIMPISAKCR